MAAEDKPPVRPLQRATREDCPQEADKNRAGQLHFEVFHIGKDR